MTALNPWLQRLLHPHQRLPSGVHEYPTVLGQRRFELLVLFNGTLAVYIAIHQFIMPVVLWLTQTDRAPMPSGLGFWYLYHMAAAVLLLPRFRKPPALRRLANLAWFAVGASPILLVASFLSNGEVHVSWKTVSGILCYLTSLILTLFLLYRLRMPTTAYLYGMKDRLLPRWRYAIPALILGIFVAVAWIRYIEPAITPPSKSQPAGRVPQANPRAIYQ